MGVIIHMYMYKIYCKSQVGIEAHCALLTFDVDVYFCCNFKALLSN